MAGYTRVKRTKLFTEPSMKGRSRARNLEGKEACLVDEELLATCDNGPAEYQKQNPTVCALYLSDKSAGTFVSVKAHNEDSMPAIMVDGAHACHCLLKFQYVRVWYMLPLGRDRRSCVSRCSEHGVWPCFSRQWLVQLFWGSSSGRQTKVCWGVEWADDISRLATHHLRQRRDACTIAPHVPLHILSP